MPCTGNLNVMVVFISCPVNAFEFEGQCNPSNKCITGRKKKTVASTCVLCTIYAVITYLHFSGLKKCRVCCPGMHSATGLVDKRVSRVVKLGGFALTVLLALSSKLHDM